MVWNTRIGWDQLLLRFGSAIERKRMNLARRLNHLGKSNCRVGVARVATSSNRARRL